MKRFLIRDKSYLSENWRKVFYYGVADQIKLFVLSLVLDRISGHVFGLDRILI